ncbi:MAG: hypothetical protein U9N76_01120 [Candidatus Marinimicrobia bacterium]|nr:hypothetical protein [Candidatus Neomarinimicrobiota bacterium]
MSKNTFTKDLTGTYISQFATAVFGVLSLKIIAGVFSEEQFGAFLIAKRIGQIGFAIVTMNLGMSLAKYIPQKKYESNNWLLLTFTSFFILFIFVFLLSFIFKNQLSKIFFGDSQYSFLFISAIIYLFSYSIQNISSNYWRGNSKFKIMNLINPTFHLFSIIVMLLFALFNVTTNNIFAYYFIVYSALIIGFNIIILIVNVKNKFSIKETFNFFLKSKTEIKNYLYYGISRLPSGFFYSAIFFLPIFLAQNYYSLTVAAHIGIIISVANLFMLFGIPFNLLFLPRFSNYKFFTNDEYIRNRSQDIINFIFSVPFLLSAFLFLFSNEIIFLWFGEKYISVGHYLMSFSPAIGFFISFVIIRSVLDGLENFPYSNIITIMSLFTMVFVILLLIVLNSFGMLGLTIAFGSSLAMLGVSSIYFLKIKTGVVLFNKQNIFAMSWFFIVFILFLIFNTIIKIDSLISLVFVKILISILIIFLTFFIYRKLNYFWLDNIIAKIKLIIIKNQLLKK